MAGSHISNGNQGGEQRGIMPITSPTAASATGEHRRKLRKTAAGNHPSHGSEEEQGIMTIAIANAAAGDNLKAHSGNQQNIAGSHLSNAIKEDQQGIISITTTTTGIGDHWEVQYARFFNRPSLSSSTGTGALHPSLVRTVKPKGSWISSFASLAQLKLLTIDHSDTSRSIILTVTLIGTVVEEHFISKLHFTWPQVSCSSGFPPRGSKVVFMSYKDQVGKIQKFVVRFLSVDETERFINLLKEIFGHERITESVSGISESKTSSQSEIVPSFEAANRPTQGWDLITSSVDFSEPMYRPIQDWSPIASPADTHFQPQHPSENRDGSQNSNPLESAYSQNVQEKLSAFPPSFTSLLMNCSPVAEQATQPIVTEDANLRDEIMKVLGDSSFQEMLSKVQKAVSEFEDDLVM